MAGAYARESANAYAREAASRGFSPPPAWPHWSNGGERHGAPWSNGVDPHSRSFSDIAYTERGRPLSPMRGVGLAEGRHLSPRAETMLRSPTRLAEVSTTYGSHFDMDRSGDAFSKASMLPAKDAGHHPRAFEHVQTEILMQSRRQDDMFEAVARVEADLGRVARLAVENEELHATERQQKHAAMSTLTRRTEDALLTCESMRKGQERLVEKVERLEASSKERERAAPEESRLLQREVDSLQATMREKLDSFGHALRRLDAMEQIFDENTKLRQEVAQLRRANERRDLEMAAVQGQIDALTKLVREQLREPMQVSTMDS